MAILTQAQTSLLKNQLFSFPTVFAVYILGTAVGLCQKLHQSKPHPSEFPGAVCTNTKQNKYSISLLPTQPWWAHGSEGFCSLCCPTKYMPRDQNKHLPVYAQSLSTAEAAGFWRSRNISDSHCESRSNQVQWVIKWKKTLPVFQLQCCYVCLYATPSSHFALLGASSQVRAQGSDWK